MDLSIDFGLLNARLHDSHPEWMCADPNPIFEQGPIEIFIHPSLNTIVSVMSQTQRYLALERAIRSRFRIIS